MAQIDSSSWQTNQRTTFTPIEIKFYTRKNFVSNRGLTSSFPQIAPIWHFWKTLIRREITTRSRKLPVSFPDFYFFLAHDVPFEHLTSPPTFFYVKPSKLSIRKSLPKKTERPRRIPCPILNYTINVPISALPFVDPEEKKGTHPEHVGYFLVFP